MPFGGFDVGTFDVAEFDVGEDAGEWQNVTPTINFATGDTVVAPGDLVEIAVAEAAEWVPVKAVDWLIDRPSDLVRDERVHPHPDWP